jgi:MFS family permease
MTAAAAAPSLPPAPAALRWGVLVLVSLALFGNYYAYDAIGPLADHLQRLLGYSDTQIGTLNAIYSLPNMVMVLVGGIIVDRLGTRLATLVFAAVCFLGALVTALSPAFKVMALGRLLYGLGAESMIVAITVVIGQWFVGRQLGFAFGINLSIARMGSLSADLSPTWARTFYEAGWQPPLALAAGLAGTALAASLAYFLLERAAERRYALGAAGPTDRVEWKDLLAFNGSLWLVIALCVAFYAVIFPFRTFSIKFFQHAHGLSLEAAGAMNSRVMLAAIVATPLFGLLVDRTGHRALFMSLGSLLLVAAFGLLGLTHSGPATPTLLIGVAFSLVPAVLWPAVPYLVEPQRLGTAYGLMTMLQNVGMMVGNRAAGMLNDGAGAGLANPAGYRPMLWMFGLLSLAGLAFAVLLRLRETGPRGHGLERVRAPE